MDNDIVIVKLGLWVNGMGCMVVWEVYSIMHYGGFVYALKRRCSGGADMREDDMYCEMDRYCW